MKPVSPVYVRKSLLVVCGVLVIFIGATRTPAQDELPELVRRIKPSAVAIETYDARGEKLSRGSGFFIDVDRIVTNRHVRVRLGKTERWQKPQHIGIARRAGDDSLLQ